MSVASAKPLARPLEPLPVFSADVWKLICRKLALSKQFRLFLASVALRQQLKSIITFEHLPAGAHYNALYLLPDELGPLLRDWSPKPTIPAEYASIATRSLFNLTRISCDDSPSGLLNLLADNGCPLRYVSLSPAPGGGDTFGRIRPESLRKLKPTLRHFYLWFFSVNTSGDSLIPTIVSELSDSLISLAISTEHWQAFRSMNALEQLIILRLSGQKGFSFDVQSSADLAEVVAELSAGCPPKVGTNLIVMDKSLFISFNSLFVFNDRGLPTALLGEIVDAVDPNRPRFQGSFPEESTSLVLSYIPGSFEVAKVLIDHGCRLTGLLVRGKPTTVFWHTLENVVADEEWLTFATYLFGAPWRRALAGASAAELLGCALDQLLFRIFQTSNTERRSAASFVVWHPEVFGPLSFKNQIDQRGRNLAFYCGSGMEFMYLIGNGVKFGTTDKAGRLPFEVIPRSPINDRDFIASILPRFPEKQFLHYCSPAVSPYVWGALYANELDSSFRACLTRLVAIVPEEHWYPAIFACIYVNLQRLTLTSIWTIIQSEDAPIRAVGIRALLAPVDEPLLFQPWLSNYYSFRPFMKSPMPHLIVARALTSSGEFEGQFLGMIRRNPHLVNVDNVISWLVDSKDAMGRTPYQLLVRKLTSPKIYESHSILETSISKYRSFMKNLKALRSRPVGK